MAPDEQCQTAAAASGRRRAASLPSGLVRWATRLMLAAVSLTAATFAYAYQFSTFRDHDDEGCMMMSVRFMLDGRRLYEDLKVFYGPAYYASRWVLFGLLRLPLTNDCVRIVTFATWLAAAALVAVSVFRLVKHRRNRFVLAAICGTLAVLQLVVLANEPGHPQELVVIGVGAALLAASYATEARMAYVALTLGVIAAGLCLTKVNIGVFFTAGCLLTLASQSPKSSAWRVPRILIALGSLALPAFLLRLRLHTEAGQAFVISMTTGLALCTWLAFREAPGSPVKLRDWVWFLLGAAVAAAAMTGFAVARGASLAGMVDCLWIMPSRILALQHGPFDFPLPLTQWNMVWSLLGAGIAVLYVCSKGESRTRLVDRVVSWLKLAVAALTVLAPCGHPVFFLHYSPPWIWLALVVPGRRQAPSEEVFFRRLVSFTGILQFLQIYPVPGSQLAIGSFAMIPLGVLCLADWIEDRQNAPAGHGLLVARIGSAVIGVAALASLALHTVHSVWTFLQCPAVDFPGCRLTRMRPRQAVIYRWLVENISSADMFLDKSGSGSLYFWTNRSPIDPDLVGWASWVWSTEQWQRKMIDACRKAKNPLVIDRQRIARLPWNTTRFVELIRRDFSPVAAAGPYTLYRRADASEKPLLACAWCDRVDSADNWVGTAYGRTPVELRIALPRGVSIHQVGQIVVLDLLKGKILARATATPHPPSGTPTTEHVADLSAAKNCQLFLAGPHGEARLLVPDRLLLVNAQFPIVILMDQAGHRLTALPVVRPIRQAVLPKAYTP